MSKTNQNPNQIFQDSIHWLLNSDIRIKNGKNKGALFGWKNLNPVSFPFIYSEITGYSITCFSWIYSQYNIDYALQAAKDASEWITKNMRSYILVARLSGSNISDETNNQYYAFDNGMIMIGLLNLYKIIKKPDLLKIAEYMGRTLVDRFFNGLKLTARLDKLYNPIAEIKDGGIVKWSTTSGSYHSKLSIGLLELSRLTNNKLFKEVSDSICDYAITLQKSNGQFITNPGSNITYLHPHLYSCEGLIFSGLRQSNVSHYTAGLNGIRWAIEQIGLDGTRGLMRDTRKESVEQSDCIAQLLRLLILCRLKLEENLSVSELDNMIDRLHSRLLDFYIPGGEDKGAVRYQLTLDSACSWCTMFSMQALDLWNKTRSENLTWIDYFV